MNKIEREAAADLESVFVEDQILQGCFPAGDLETGQVIRLQQDGAYRKGAIDA